MPNWGEILEEIQKCDRTNPADFTRRKYLKKLSDITGRNTISYYSGWLQRQNVSTNMSINDDDKNGFMSVIHNMNRDLGLDLILHTPGGDIAATESIVDYLRKMFGNNIRVIVPQLAMSAGTMIACASKEIIMGKQSNLGPIDPHFNGISTHGVIEEFSKAFEEIQANPQKIPIWQVIIGKYNPTFLGDCEKAISWSSEIVEKWLVSGMFESDVNAEQKAKDIICQLNNHVDTKSHSRHIPIDECQRMGLKILTLEDTLKEEDFQDAVLSVHHANMITFSSTHATKIIENNNGSAYIKNEAPVITN